MKKLLAWRKNAYGAYGANVSKMKKLLACYKKAYGAYGANVLECKSSWYGVRKIMTLMMQMFQNEKVAGMT